MFEWQHLELSGNLLTLLVALLCCKVRVMRHHRNTECNTLLKNRKPFCKSNKEVKMSMLDTFI